MGYGVNQLSCSGAHSGHAFPPPTWGHSRHLSHPYSSSRAARISVSITGDEAKSSSSMVSP